MITLEKLTWNNCFSYGSDNVIDLQKNTLTQLIGTNVNCIKMEKIYLVIQLQIPTKQ